MTDKKFWRDGLLVSSTLLALSLIEYISFGFWMHGIIAVFSAVLVAVTLYEGGKNKKNNSDGQRV